jgi:hypothetical protein
MMNAYSTPDMSRRKLLGASAAGAAAVAAGGILAQATAASASAVSHSTGPVNGGLAEAVIGALQTHQLVAIGEDHQLQEHHDALQPLLADPRLPDLVDDIVVEFGNSLYQDVADQFILGDDEVNDADLRPIWRNTTQSPTSTNDAPIYEQFFRKVRGINWNLPPSKRIRVLLGDPPMDWSQITSSQQVEPFSAERDSYPASLVEQEVLAKGRRALMHYGGEHLLHVGAFPSMTQTVVTLIEQKTGVRAYSVIDIVPMTGDPGGLGTQLSRYPRNTVIPATGTWLGDVDAGDVIAAIAGTRGTAPINPFCGIKLGEILDAGTYLGQPEVLTASWPNPAIYLDPTYWAELQRRNTLLGSPANLNSYLQQPPPLYPAISTPACAASS